MKILVIGGTMLTGPHIVRQLVDLSHSVTVFHRGVHEAELPAQVRHVHGDCDHLADSAGELRRLAPDVVLAMWALTEEQAVALMGTFHGAAGRVVVISSIDAYRAYGRLHRFEPGPPDPVPLTEDSPLREKIDPIGGLRYNKTAVERVVMGDPELPATIVRYPAVYGPGDEMHRLFHEGLKRMLDGRPAILLDEGMARWRFSHGYTENLAHGVTLAVTSKRAAGQIYNLAEKETLPRAEWLRKIGQVAGWAGEVVTVPKAQLPAHLQHNLDTDQQWVVDTSRIREELGYEEPKSLEEGLRRTIDWERQHPPEKIDPKAFDYAAEDALLEHQENRSGG